MHFAQSRSAIPTCASTASRISSHASATTSARTPWVTRRAPRLACRASADERHGAEAASPQQQGASDAQRSVTRAGPEELSVVQQQQSEQSPASPLQSWLYPEPSELSEDFQMPIWDHLDELRERVLVAALAGLVAVLACFCFSKELVVFLEAPVVGQGVKFLQLSPGEFFFTTLQVAGYAGLLLATPTVLYEIIAYVVPGLTKSERRLLAPVIFGSSILFYLGLLFAYEILTPAALKFFVEYADGAVESLWSIDQYFQFVLVLLMSTGLSFQVPVIQVLLGQFGLVTSSQMFSQWKFVVVGATVAAAVLTPSTDPFTQTLLAVPLIGLYLGGAAAVRVLESTKSAAGTS